MKALSERGEKTLESLRKSVRAVLERKKRLGQYAVIWKDGKVQFLGKSDNEQEEARPG